MIIVAYLYNTNGMASWCWEAAHALAEAGESVTLVCAPNVDIPATGAINVLRFAPPEVIASGNKISREFRRLSGKSSEFVYHLHNYLLQVGITPSAYFLNQSDLLSMHVEVPQYVVAWAYPTSLIGYLSKIVVLSGSMISTNTIRVAFDAVGWWRKDWFAYRNATSILAVTKQLQASLAAAGVTATAVHPGTAIRSDASRPNRKKTHKILICAQDLEDPRKRTTFLLNALMKLSTSEYSLTLIGHVTDDFRRRTEHGYFPVTFVGPLPRNEVQLLMAEHDIFLFGSCLDDWGYVLVEAMSQGLCVVAPKLSPFDEIVGDAGVLYSPYSEEDLCLKLGALLHKNLHQIHEDAQARASELFSRRAFSHTLLKVLPAH